MVTFAATSLPLPVKQVSQKAVVPEGWPPLPEDLYFVREGRLWHWLAAGGEPQALTPVSGDPIRQYRLLSGGAGIICWTQGNRLYLLRNNARGRVEDLMSISSEPIQEYHLVDDERTLYYMDKVGQLYVVDLFPEGNGLLKQTLIADHSVQMYRLTNDAQMVFYLTEAGHLYVVEPFSADIAPYTLITEEHVNTFKISPDGRYVVYQVAGGFHFLDRVSNSSYFLATEFLQYQFTLDSRYFVYLSGGNISAVDVQMPGKPFTVGSCAGSTGEAVCDSVNCEGFTISPNGERIGYTDARGVWVGRFPGEEPQLRMASEGSGLQLCGPIVEIHSWSPDSRMLLLERRYYEGSDLAVLHLDTGQAWELPGSFCYVDCYREYRWHSQGLWVTSSGFGGGEIYLAGVTPDGELEIEYWFPPIAELTGICPQSLRYLPDDRLAFIHPGWCAERGCYSGVDPAIFAVDVGGNLERLAPLPIFDRRYDHDDVLLWSPSGAAFLYQVKVYARGRFVGQAPILLGLTNGSSLWDVRGLLAGATGFRWGISTQ